MTIPKDVEVEFEELDAAHGGLESPFVTDSRPQFFYQGHDWDCRIEIIRPGAPQPRIGVRAYLAFLSPDAHLGQLHPGTPFLIRYGQRTVAFGKVLRLLELETSAREAAARSEAERVAVESVVRAP
jgi:translation elongation factor EF-Tu-like GTPase